MDRGDWRATVHGITKCWAWLQQHGTHGQMSLMGFNLTAVSMCRDLIITKCKGEKIKRNSTLLSPLIS